MDNNTIIIYDNKSSDPNLFYLKFQDCSIANLIVSLLALFHNILFATIAYRLQWFEFYQFFLICNQVIADIISSIFWILKASVNIIMVNLDCVRISDTCTVSLYLTFLATLPVRISLSASQKAAIGIAIDRLYLLIFPYRWIKRTTQYRVFLIGVAWTWAILQETLPILILSKTLLVTDWDLQNSVVEYLLASSVADSLLLLILYIIAGVVSASFCKRATKGTKNTRVYCSRMEITQRKIVMRVNALAFLTIISHFLMAIVLFTTSSTIIPWIKFPEAVPIGLSYSIWPLYIFAWRDVKFRRELKKIVISRTSTPKQEEMEDKS